MPAHNEGMVIARTLRELTTGALPDELDVVVVCNGCTDNTATIARSFGAPIRVIETPLGNKAHALNLGDQASRSFPRVYVDADVIVALSTIRTLLEYLENESAIAVAPMSNKPATGRTPACRTEIAEARRPDQLSRRVRTPQPETIPRRHAELRGSSGVPVPEPRSQVRIYPETAAIRPDKTAAPTPLDNVAPAVPAAARLRRSHHFGKE